jgi:threonine synthase
LTTQAVEQLVVSCVRCGASTAAFERQHTGCASCRADGVPSNYAWEADPADVRRAFLHPSARDGIWRFDAALPALEPITLGEGGTPLLALRAVGRALGVANLYVKNEAANPTWSHKDRLAAVTVAAARARGASVLGVASTGNHGAAVAAYAARAGLRCVIATLPTVPPSMKTLMLAYGATVVATDTSEQRYELIDAGVKEDGWYPASNLTVPPVGSDPLGIAAYTTIAYELVAQVGRAPDWIVVPVAYGDCLAGIVQGFTGLQAAEIIERPPRVLAVELFGALERALADGTPAAVATHPTRAFSIAASATTYQAVAAVKRVEGTARSVCEDDIAAAQTLLGREGVFVEAAGAASLAGAAAFAREGAFGRDDDVVCLLTSTGLKDIPGDAPSVPTVEPRLDALRDALGLAPGASL